MLKSFQEYALCLCENPITTSYLVAEDFKMFIKNEIFFTLKCRQKTVNVAFL